MKKSLLTKTVALTTATLAVGVLFFTVSAKAEENYVNKYSCSNDELHALDIDHEINEAGTKKALVHLNTNTRAGSKTYTAVYEKVLNTETYKLFDGEVEVGLVKVTTQQKIGRGGGFCGRAGCDFPSPIVPVYLTYAALKIGEYEDSFDCNQ